MNAEWVIRSRLPQRTAFLAEVAQRHPLWMRTAFAFALLMLHLRRVRAARRPHVQRRIGLVEAVQVLAVDRRLFCDAGLVRAAASQRLHRVAQRALVDADTGCVCGVRDRVHRASGEPRSSVALQQHQYALFGDVRFMGVGAVAMVSICLWMGVAILRNRGTTSPYALAVGVGLVLTFAAGGRLRRLPRRPDEPLGRWYAERRERRLADELVARRR